MQKEQIITILVVLYIIINSFLIEPNAIEVTKYSIPNNSIAGFKVVFVSDWHLKRNEYKRLRKIIKLINNENPNIVISGGDYAPSKNYKEMMNSDIMAQTMGLINAPIYSVLGEYDWYSNGEDIAKNLQKHDVKVLENSSTKTVYNRKIINIVGYADLTAREIKAAKAIRGASRPRILVTHNPDVYYNVIEDYDLILAGHTHGGQITIPLIPPLITKSKYKFYKGEFSPNKNTMIVTRGLSAEGLRVRFNCKPEIVVINFVKK